MVTEQEIDKVFSECKELLLKRNAKYGNSWKGARLSSIIDYVLMKYNRLNKMVDNPKENYEKIKTDLMDALNYAVFGLIMLEDVK